MCCLKLPSFLWFHPRIYLWCTGALPYCSCRLVGFSGTACLYILIRSLHLHLKLAMKFARLMIYKGCYVINAYFLQKLFYPCITWCFYFIFHLFIDTFVQIMHIECSDVWSFIHTFTWCNLENGTWIRLKFFSFIWGCATHITMTAMATVIPCSY